MSDDNPGSGKTKIDEKTIRLTIELKESADSNSYIHVDYLELSRDNKPKLKERKESRDASNDEEVSKTSDDSNAEALARFYEEKYGRGDDYAELGEGYDEEDSFIDNADAIRDLLPSGLKAEFGGFYINRGKLNLVKEDSSSSFSDHGDQFVHQPKRVTRRITSDSEEDGKKENGKVMDIAQPIKSRKRSGEFCNKNKNTKKFRKMATPKIPEHLLQKKPFSGSEFNKNIKEIKKNRLKSADEVEKIPQDNANANAEMLNNKKPANQIPIKKKESPKILNQDAKELDKVIEAVVTAAEKPSNATVEEAIEAVVTGADLKKNDDDGEEEEIRERSKDDNDKDEDDESSSSCSSSSSSSSDSDSDSSSRTSEKTVPSPGPGKSPARTSNETRESTIPRSGSACSAAEPNSLSFSSLDESIKQLVQQISDTSREEKCRVTTQRINKLLLCLDDRLNNRPSLEKDLVFNAVSLILNFKKSTLIKKTKKLKFSQLDYRMSTCLRRLKEAVAERIPRLEAEYFKEFTSATGTRIDSNSPPQRKFPWDNTLRGYLQEIIIMRQNCYNLLRPRKESVTEYVHTFLECKVKPFWPKEWMTMEALLREAQAISLKSSNGPSSAKHQRIPTAAPLKKITTPSSQPPVSRPRKPGPVSKATLVQRRSPPPPSSTASPIIQSPKTLATHSLPRTKTIEFPSAAVPSIGVRTPPKGLSISPVKDNLPVESEILNLTKNSAVSISKIASRSASPSIIPLPAGTTISPAGPPSNFATRPDIPAAITMTKHDMKNIGSTNREDCHESKSISISKEVTLIKHEPIKTPTLSREIEISVAKPILPHKDVWRESNSNPTKDTNSNKPKTDVSKDALSISNSHSLPSTARKGNYDTGKPDQWRSQPKAAVESVSSSQDSRKQEIKRDTVIESRKESNILGKIERDGLVIRKTDVPPNTSCLRATDVPFNSSIDPATKDKYKNMSVRKRALNEYLGQQTDLNKSEKVKPEILDKGLNMFSKMLDNCKSNSEHISSRKARDTVIPAPATDLTEQLVQLEMDRVMQNIMNLSSSVNTDVASDATATSSNLNHAFKNNSHN